MTKFEHRLAGVLGIELRRTQTTKAARGITRGESSTSVTDLDAYSELEPTVTDWFKDNTPTSEDARNYVVGLFPVARWLPRYNVRWLLGDIIAGITVGSVVIPQGMAYASLAQLPPQFGLYSSFMGVLVYWLFATSKDITIGPVAVMSTITGNVVLRVKDTDPDIPGHIVASALAILAGCIILFIGLIRYGWIVEFISLAAIASFMTGSALNIIVGQVPTLLGIVGFSTRDATYLVIINTLKHLSSAARYDAAMGVSALVLLYIIRFSCQLASKRWPYQRKIYNFLATTRVVMVMLLFVLISWIVNRNQPTTPEFKILGTIPRGFQNAGVPYITIPVIKTFASQLPVTVIVLWIEHIAIAKAFGRVNHYTIDNSQEMVAIGLTNILGPFLGAYPTTGSFSRTAINSKAGVCSPAGGLFTAALVLLGIYALPAMLYYIPNASLAAVIIHAVGDLITSPDTLYQFWKVSPFEVLIFFVGVFVTVFSTIEIGVYTTICLSLALLLYRFAKAQGAFLGKVKVHAVVGDRVLPEHGGLSAPSFANSNNPDISARNVFLPIDHKDGSNTDIQVDAPYPGIFIYRFTDGFNYSNANNYLDQLLQKVYRSTRPGKIARLADDKHRTWSDLQLPTARDSTTQQDLPQLEAIILDFSAVNNVDITAIQQLIDVRNQLDRWAAPETPEWHIASISNKWTRRSLVHAGFGYPTPDSPYYHRWKPVFSVADAGGGDSAATVAQLMEMEKARRKARQQQGYSRQSRASKDNTSSIRDSITAKSNSLHLGAGGSRPHIRLPSVDEERGASAQEALPDTEPGDDRKINVNVETTVDYSDAHPPTHGLSNMASATADWSSPPRPPPAHKSSTIAPSGNNNDARLAMDLEAQLHSTPAYNASISALNSARGQEAGTRLPKVTLVNGLDKPLFHVVEGASRPLFHVGLSSALQSAICNVEVRKEIRKMAMVMDNRADTMNGSDEDHIPMENV